jgi:hypothetical protein
MMAVHRKAIGVKRSTEFVCVVCLLSLDCVGIYLNVLSHLSARVAHGETEIINLRIWIESRLLSRRALGANVKIEYLLEEPTFDPFLKHRHKSEDQSPDCNSPICSGPVPERHGSLLYD